MNKSIEQQQLPPSTKSGRTASINSDATNGDCHLGTPYHFWEGKLLEVLASRIC